MSYPRMDPRVKRKWVGALRSGRYVQGKGRLVRERFSSPELEYCCLGVLAAECRPESIRPDGHPDGERFPVVDGQPGMLPDDLATLWGLSMDAQSKLVSLNDGGVNDEGRTFPRIADWIERNL